MENSADENLVICYMAFYIIVNNIDIHYILCVFANSACVRNIPDH